MSSSKRVSSHVRVKQEKIIDGFEVQEARIKLGGVLQTLVDKADDVGNISEEEGAKGSPEQSGSKDLPGSNSASPSKKSGKNPRKRKKKDGLGMDYDKSAVETTQLQHTYIMKLFDRSVDLAQFDSSTSLYPICREWMHNQPQTRLPHKGESSPDNLPADDSDDEAKSVYHLPSPHKSVEDKDIRVPSPVPQPDEEFKMNSDGVQAPSVETLLSNHLDRWKTIRHKWKDASQANQARYSESYSVLKNMYDRQ
ncbi:protein lin-37 homolog isoform X2 [Saccoglossus kowalevskii]|uniref:Protein lin-37 homolog isoform X2 n=1 Tax=Saccoglossus kowalevskii TaxID=10224 RepID=A0ABM0MU03_SACKO|nr:PREDICTED: protein lin-37 homolog isoform X2 [Saccoglossus kowalevskii]